MSCLVVMWVIFTQEQEETASTSPANVAIKTKIAATTKSHQQTTTVEQEEELQEMRDKFRIHRLQYTEKGELLPHQFLYLHHMKTGGTSVDHMLKCAMERLADTQNISVPYFTTHENWHGRFNDCVLDASNDCRPKIERSAMMSFCGPLLYLEKLGWRDGNHWKQSDTTFAITVLRHPVDRVWSMFRAQTRMCYRCKNLTEIYELMDSGGNMDIYDSLCLKQLSNQQVGRLVTTNWPSYAPNEEVTAEAIDNMKSMFTVVGLTEELEFTQTMLGGLFPWFNVSVEGSSKTCNLPHDNRSPVNNLCNRHKDSNGKWKSSHWDLPSHPDDETRKAIEAHNQMDIKLYEAAVLQFELQKRALGMR